VLLFFAGCSRSQFPGGSSNTIIFVNKSENVNHLWLMDLNNSGIGNHPRRLTSNAEAENYPSWSPDGRQLLYQRDYNGSAIYVVDADGKNQHRLSPTPGFDATPSWSPDGTRIIYTRIAGLIMPGQVPKTEIRVMNADGSGDRVILPTSDFSVEPRWSVNNQIVFMSRMNGGQQIFIMNDDGTDIRQLTRDGDNGDPAWSPNGTQISFGSDREGNGKLNIFVMNADGGGARQLTHFQAPDESGDTNWSPDGTKIIFEFDVAGQLQSNPNVYAAVWTINANGTQPLGTGQPCSSVGCAPRWQPK
jgi:Tol biopolymer transport system component